MKVTNNTHENSDDYNKARIIGIGASAGGLEALRQFFSHIPNKINASFVIVQHLSPDFKSLMNELLSRYTTLPITTINEDMPIRPNHIYLIPRNKNIVIKNGILRLVNRSPNVRLNLPIDIFFHSLGNDQGSNAIGVILSGSGTDGSRGVRTIKEAGGIVLAQDPNTAKFNGMPLATITIGLADNVLPPASLAETIIKIANNYTGKPLEEVKDSNFQTIFEQILLKVYSATSIDFQVYRKQTLLRRTQKRMQLNHLNKMADYIEYIERKPEEAKLLGREFLIGVTRFFRDPEAFEILRDKVIPDIVKRMNPYETIRVWVSACSTGEEAYSIAMLFMEYMMQNDLEPNFKIFATDVDEQAINLASEGFYYDNIVADVSSKRLEHFFDFKIDKFKIKKKIRERIIFVNHDVLQDPPFINADLVCCRNFLIYLGTQAQEKLLDVFHFSLNQEGYLFLGPSESIGSLKHVFHTVDQKWNIFRNIHATTKSAKRRSAIWPTRSLPQKNNEYLQSSGGGSSTHSRRYLDTKKEEVVFTNVLLKRHSPICLFLNKNLDILYINGDVGQLLHFPRALVKMNIESLLETKESLLFRSGVRRVLDEAQSVMYKDIPFNKGEQLFHLDMNFSLVRIAQISAKVILVEIHIKNKAAESSNLNVLEINTEAIREERIRTLEIEAREAREQKESLVEELETTNEELQASNEELLASNEELQSTNEELQSVNEELYTVNTELQSKIEELTTVSNDVVNLLKSTEIATIFLDNYLRIRKFTDAIQEQLDLVDGDIGRPITAFSHTLQDVDLAALAKKVLVNLNTIEREVQDVHDNFFLMRILPYRTADNIINGVVITFTNINEIKAITADIQETSARYKAVFENAIDNITICDIEGTLLDFNYTYDGFDAKEIRGTNMYKYIPENEKETVKKAVANTLKTSQNSFYKLNFELPTGEIMYLESRVSPIVKNGEIHEIAISTRNLSNMKTKELEIIKLNEGLEKEVTKRTIEWEETNERLEELNSYLDDFVNGAIHDLRAPIIRLKSYVETLTKPKNETDREKVLKRMKIVSTKLENVLNGLMHFLEFQNNIGQAILSISLKDIFYEVKSQFTDELTRIPHTLNTNFNDVSNFYYVKPYLNSMIYNLLDNAIKYRDENRDLEINIHTERQDNGIIFSITDNGIGINLERYGHLLFQPFRRINNSREGASIGLSILNNTIKKNGGKIEVESEVGKGTTFKVFIKPYMMMIED